MIASGLLRVSHAGREVAVHPRRSGWFEWVVDPAHFVGVVGFSPKPRAESLRIADAISSPELLRPLFEYERVVGGRW